LARVIEDAVLHVRGDLLRVDLHGESDAASEAERGPLAAMRRVALGDERLALAADRQHAVLQRYLEVLLRHARYIGGDEEVRACIEHVESRPAGGRQRLRRRARDAPRPVIVVPDAVHLAAELVEDVERAIEIGQSREHDVALLTPSTPAGERRACSAMKMRMRMRTDGAP
jgi:hypothetical protein